MATEDEHTVETLVRRMVNAQLLMLNAIRGGAPNAAILRANGRWRLAMNLIDSSTVHGEDLFGAAVAVRVYETTVADLVAAHPDPAPEHPAETLIGRIMLADKRAIRALNGGAPSASLRLPEDMRFMAMHLLDNADPGDGLSRAAEAVQAYESLINDLCGLYPDPQPEDHSPHRT